ncbi:MAG: beta-galactosidase [Lentisphaeria bacterium]|nr:beta-galactosidase [Lentisphaeria bacterium]
MILKKTLVVACLFTLVLTLTAPAHAQTTAAQWIWYPESPAVDCYKEFRWFRASFDLEDHIAEATLWLLVDDRHVLWLNGIGPLKPVETRDSSHRYDVAKALARGRNVIAIEGWNGGNVAGVIARLTVKLANGRETVITSDQKWRASREASDGWNKPEFDDSAWSPVRVVGDAFARPWIDIPSFHMPVFYTKKEAAAKARQHEKLLAPAKQFTDLPATDARLGWVNDMPAFVINGQPQPVVFYRGILDPLREHGRRQIANFRDADVHMFCVYARLRKCWPAPDEYDFSSVDEQIRAYLAIDPNAWIVLLVRIIPPNWWMDSHPDELVGYGTGSDFVNNEQDRVRRGSIASEVWLRDTSAAWQALVRHVEDRPWGKRVIGYQPGYGISAEWHYFGSWREQYPDTGAAMTQAFRNWLRERYETDAALRAAWGQTQVALSTASVPDVASRRGAKHLALRDPVAERRVIDYYHCHQKTVSDAIDRLGRIVKQQTNKHKLYGVYYGYFFGTLPQTQGGHLELPALLASPNVDFLVAPYSYSERLMGQDGRLRSLAGAFRLTGKLHILEGDIRTWLHSRNEYGRTENRQQSMAAIAREFSTALIERAGFWYVDFGPDSDGGWFDDPKIMAQAATLHGLAARALRQPRSEMAQIALVCDLESPYYLSDGEGMKIALRMVEDVTTELHHIGAPFDAIHLDQLADADLERYRMLVFLNTIGMTDEQAALVRRLRQDGQHAMVFLWAPGVCSPHGFAPERASQLIGMDLQLVEDWLPGGVEITLPEDPLTTGIAASEEVTITPVSSTFIKGFDDEEKWLNPRDKRTMERQYKHYEVTRAKGGVQWIFDTSHNYTDLHFHAPVPEADGIGCDLRFTGTIRELGFLLVVKDANLAEFVAPDERLVAGRQYHLDYPLAVFKNAPWSRHKPDRIALPLRGAKFVFKDTSNVGACTVVLKNLRAVKGTVERRRIASFGSGVFGPALVPSGAQSRLLGTLAGTEYAGLAARGKGRGAIVFCAAPFLPRQVLANLAQAAGVHRYLDNLTDVVRADSRFIAIHTKEGGRRTLNLRVRSTVRDAMTGVEIGRGSRVPLNLSPDSTSIYELTTDDE